MKHMRYWLSSKRRLIAQLQEARDECDTLGDHLVDSWDYSSNLLDQLHRVARERDKERELRLAAEAARVDRYTISDKTLKEAANELRDVYLEQLANEEE